MRAYTELLVKTCHRRGAHAMGGMAALIPSRTDAEANEQAIAGGARRQGARGGRRLRRHLGRPPRLVDVAMEQFDAVLGDRAQPGRPPARRRRGERRRAARRRRPRRATITEEGLRNDVNVGIQYISSWLRGNGAAAIYGLMEDAATAEISRSQVWQWLRHGVELDDGTHGHAASSCASSRPRSSSASASEIGDDEWFEREGRPEESRELFEQVALAEDFVEFLTLPAYERLD